MSNPVTDLVNSTIVATPPPPQGDVARVARNYYHSGDRLLGFPLNLSYEDMQIITCDPWKQKCGGVPRNSFVIVKLSPNAIRGMDQRLADRVILARVTESVPTPVHTDVQNTIFQVHKVQAILDPMTHKELQWGALKASIVGTYYDAGGTVQFGNDVDTFFAPHSYEVYVPTDDDLALLLNSFVKTTTPLRIGTLKYTETPALVGAPNVPVNVNPDDFIGYESGHRTALFGKTRTGKSNTIKVIADTILGSNRSVGQVIFDPSGEYSYLNPQDKTSIYALHTHKCVRYSLNPRLTPEEAALGFAAPFELKANFFENIALGHSIISGLFGSVFGNPPNYMRPVLDWHPPDLKDEPGKATDASGWNRFWRAISLYYALLIDADYDYPKAGKPVPVPLQANTRKQLAQVPSVRTVASITQNAAGDDVLAETQGMAALVPIYRAVASLYSQYKGQKDWFSTSDGSDYYSETQSSILKILAKDGNISGPIYIRPFRSYHSLSGSNVVSDIVKHVDGGNTVLVDYANAPEDVARNFSERLCRAILQRQMERFATNRLGDHFVVFYFEEAHTLFRADDKDLTSIYNKLAKEGAKFHVGMVYATQSMTTLSPDLLKNTENFIIAHLSDDREIKEVTRRFEFRDVADDVQRCRTQGYVRMITLSHRFALPVQIRKFEAQGRTQAPSSAPAPATNSSNPTP